MDDKEFIDTKLYTNFDFPDRFGQVLGYQVKDFNKKTRSAIISLVTREEHLSPSGKVHGGVISALLDFSCGAAVCTTLDEGELCSTIELKVNYFRPVELGDRLEADAKVEFRGKKICSITSKLHREGEEEPVAMATSTFNVVNPNKVK